MDSPDTPAFSLVIKTDPKTLVPQAEEPPPAQFGSEDANVLVAYVEEVFRKDGLMPSKDDLLRYWPGARKFLESEKYDEQLKLRGIPVDRLRTPSGLPVGFVNAVTLITDYSDKRSKAAKLKELGYTTRSWNGWLKEPQCQEYFMKVVDAKINSDLQYQAKLSLGQLVESNDLGAIKFLYELTGTYRPNQETMLNLTLIIGRMMEVLVKYVSPTVLPELAKELDTIIETTALETSR